jgi:hypothetical protein
VERWQLGLGFVLAIVAAALGVWALEANTTTSRAQRNAQVTVLHQAEVASCARTHQVVGVLEALVEREIAAGSGTLAAIPDLTAAQKAALSALAVRDTAGEHEFLVALQGADCKGVPPLPKVGG